MVKHNRQNTLLMEILIVVLFFALCSTVILNVFVGAHNQSARAGAQADALTAAGYKLLSAQVEMLPQNGYIKLTNEDDIKNMQKMLDMFEDNDDVQNVWHNWEDAE